MGQLTNSNICRAETDGSDGPVDVQICQGCMVDPKKKNPYWSEVSVFSYLGQAALDPWTG